MRKDTDFKKLFTSSRLVTDGAMGTYYKEKYGGGSRLPELDNLSAPDKVKEVHREYIRAGADILRTNSFASNTETLAQVYGDLSRQELLGKVRENVQAACRIARDAAVEEAAGRSIYIAGDIGPIPEHGNGDDEAREQEITEEYRTIVSAHLDAGVKLIWFETFSDFRRILPVAKWIKSVSGDTFIMASFSVNMYGYTNAGISAADLVDTAKEREVIDGIGFNCGVGPAHLAKILRRQDFGELIVFAAPNAGYADRVQNRNVYRDNIEYFGEAMEEIAGLGVNVIGGCCGTSPAYIRHLAGMPGGRKIPERPADRPEKRAGQDISYNNNLFIKRLYSGEKVVIAELDPPHDGNDGKMMEAASVLKEAGVELITFSDSPMGRMRADSAMSAVKVAGRLQVETMPHIACRDKNVIGMGAQILGAYMNGIRNFLLVTGDPVPSGERDVVTSVYDFHSVSLMQYLARMNREHFSGDPVAYGGALNYGRKNIDAEIRRMEKKCQAGAAFFLTQPIYSDEDIERIRYIKSRIDTKIICGIMPLVSYRNALFMKNEITGIHVPDEILARYDKDMSREEAQQVGVDVAAEIAEKLKDVTDGYYFMVPFNRASMIAEILKKIRN